MFVVIHLLFIIVIFHISTPQIGKHLRRAESTTNKSLNCHDTTFRILGMSNSRLFILLIIIFYIKALSSSNRKRLKTIQDSLLKKQGNTKILLTSISTDPTVKNNI